MCPLCIHAWSYLHVMSLLLALTAAYCLLLCLAPIVCRYSSLLASVGFAKDAPHNNGKSNENCHNIIILLHSLCVNDKMEPWSDMNSLMGASCMCSAYMAYILGWIDADKSINKCLCLHHKHLNRCICNLRPC